MKAMVMVAHPDDCVIFAYSLICQYPKLNWTVCYLTYTAADYRGSELAKFWNKRNIKTKFLGYVDDWHDIENEKISFDEMQAKLDIHKAISDQDIVVTRDASGDYGHLHHVFVHNAVVNQHTHIITFAGINKGTDRFIIPNGTYSLDELPEHGKIIAGFHQQEHANEYFIPDSVKELLK